MSHVIHQPAGTHIDHTHFGTKLFLATGKIKGRGIHENKCNECEFVLDDWNELIIKNEIRIQRSYV